ERGYRNYDDFITRGLSELFGISRSEGYAAIKITECFPSLTIEDYKDIGVAKLQVLSRETNESDSDFRELVGKAKELTVKELKDHIANIKHRDRGDMDAETISIVASKRVAELWRQVKSDRYMRKFVSSD